MGCAEKAVATVQDAVCFSEDFTQTFNVEVADTTQVRRDAFRLRYRVYCEERDFEQREQFPDQMERDVFDDQSVQAIVRHRPTGIPVGVVRLILRDSDESRHLLPIERTCRKLFDKKQTARFNLRRYSVAEVSRFAVSKTAIAEVEKKMTTEPFRTGGVGVPGVGVRGDSFRSIVLGLIAALFQISATRDVDHWYALMEPALARHLSRLGLRFTRIGPLVNHRGKRQPMLASLADLRHDISVKNPQLHQLIRTEGGRAMPNVGNIDHLGWSRRLFMRNPALLAADLA
jgi:N-acyl amino acid synthase of PEP-CTERM/exosortase system